jgi:molecular chaperone GrpE (heat shock protein)
MTESGAAARQAAGFETDPLSSGDPLSDPPSRGHGQPPEKMVDEQCAPAAESSDQTAGTLADIFAAVLEFISLSERYHTRAEQREGVIDHLRTEVERLRRGERRGLLRPILAENCRLRNDLLRQAEELPDDFDAGQARLLLRSYADSVELALEDSGVITFAPSEGEPFDPRLHRRVYSVPTADVKLAGRVARVLRHGYMDIEANIPMAPAEVVLFTYVTTTPQTLVNKSAVRSEADARGLDGIASAPGANEKDEP